MAVQIRKGTPADLDAFIRLLYTVHETMPVKEWFYLDSPEEFRQQMEDGIMELWLAVDGDTVVGAFDLLNPGLREFNYGYELGLSEDQLLRVVNMDSAAVHPAYRGQGLQRKLLLTAEAWLKEQGSRILLCTIHPENRYSLQNAQKIGYRIQKLVNLYGSVRYILRKDI